MSAGPDRRAFLATIAASLIVAPRTAHGAAAGSGPGIINAHGGAWDSRRRSTLIFGGADDRRVLGGLWQYRAGRWRLLSRLGPAPRTFPGIAYDSRRDRLIVFGGNRVLFGPNEAFDSLLDDHWEWDGRRWLLFEGLRPPSRTEACLIFDPIRNRTILFGGWRWQDGQRVRLADLWEFDGTRWHQSPTIGPAARSGMAATWDPIGKRVTMIGGNGPRHDAWGLTGGGWTQIADMPQGRFNPALAFDGGRNQLIVFGGWTGKERLAATLTFEGRNWRQYAGPEPAPRNHASLVPTGDGARLLLTGGHDGDRVFRDQWEWNGAWRLLHDGAPKPRIDNGH
jgi:hypothetical protein